MIDPDAFDLERLAARHDTPFYLYDLGVIEQRVELLRAALPPPFRLAFAVKANPARAVLERMAGLGLGADVASAGELGRALAAGFEPGGIVFTGPGKRDNELRAAVDAGVGLITVESPGELDRLEAIAAEAGRPTAILLRWAVPPGAVETTRIIDDGGAGKFGMDEADLRRCGRRARQSAWLDPAGIHAFGASNIRDADVLIGHARRTMAAGRELAAELGLALRTIDVGGGLGIPYADADRPLDLAALHLGLAGLAGEWAGDPATVATTVLVEPGRFLVGPAGLFVTRVIDAKRVRGRAIAIVDGGINSLLRPALVGQAQRVRRAPSIAAGVASSSSSPSGSAAEPVTIAGPLCTGLDVLARDVPFGLPEVGELLTILDAGAYGFTESMPLFLSRPVAAEVIVDSTGPSPARARDQGPAQAAAQALDQAPAQANVVPGRTKPRFRAISRPADPVEVREPARVERGPG